MVIILTLCACACVRPIANHQCHLPSTQNNPTAGAQRASSIGSHQSDGAAKARLYLTVTSLQGRSENPCSGECSCLYLCVLLNCCCAGMRGASLPPISVGCCCPHFSCAQPSLHEPQTPISSAQQRELFSAHRLCLMLSFLTHYNTIHCSSQVDHRLLPSDALPQLVSLLSKQDSPQRITGTAVRHGCFILSMQVRETKDRADTPKASPCHESGVGDRESDKDDPQPAVLAGRHSCPAQSFVSSCHEGGDSGDKHISQPETLSGQHVCHTQQQSRAVQESSSSPHLPSSPSLSPSLPSSHSPVESTQCSPLCEDLSSRQAPHTQGQQSDCCARTCTTSSPVSTAIAAVVSAAQMWLQSSGIGQQVPQGKACVLQVRVCEFELPSCVFVICMSGCRAVALGSRCHVARHAFCRCVCWFGV